MLRVQVSMRLLPLARAVRWTRLARQQMFPEAAGGATPLVLFAASFNFNKVHLFSNPRFDTRHNDAES